MVNLKTLQQSLPLNQGGAECKGAETGGLKALLMLHSPFLHLQAVDKLWMCSGREVSQGDGNGMEAGVR